MTLQQLNNLSIPQLRTELARCCGSATWIEQMVEIFPVADEKELLPEAERIWNNCSENDWIEAFSHHPRIGDVQTLKERFAATAQWAGEEQAAARQTSDAVLQALKEGNDAYAEKFGYIFIVCATGKSAPEMLHLLQARLHNTAEDEIRIAMQEQNKITQIRLQKLLAS
ncbi:MAG: 2-oxo-4-hydroxy-4-carboxy-5-ureidoimidazoline decarboxylase [Williamsia sp.]|nr:2-oxo-4-hydroxy-4-carboxy-5-ureidoimidazoline decarboxylase [Williamsia sp.]